MKKLLSYLFIAATVILMNSCAAYLNVPWQKKVIPGHYEYVHSWTYPSPEGGYTITCYEEGTIDFHSSGRYIDRAVQYHTANNAEQTCWTFDYECHGDWDVVNDKFLFTEHPQDFVMELMGVNIDDRRGNFEWAAGMADRLVLNATPKSSRWITFDIVRLNEQEFVWSYTYPDGHTDFWEMHKVMD